MLQKVLVAFAEASGKLQVVGKAESVAKAKELLHQVEADLIFVDVYLPDGRGTDLLSYIRTEGIEIDAIAITADSSADTVSRFVRLGAVDYLIKPFKYERFEQAIDRYVSQKHQLELTDSMDQGQVDQLMSKPPKSDKVRSEYQNQTYEAIIAYLGANDNESFTATDVSEALGMSRITARKYLDRMEVAGDVSMSPHYGGLGRPQNKYRINKS